MARKKKEEKPVEYWSDLVDIYFEFYKTISLDGQPPLFNGSAPRDFKNIVLALMERNKRAGNEWTQMFAILTLKNFLTYVSRIPFYRNNFSLSYISRSVDAIFARVPCKAENSKSKFDSGVEDNSIYKYV